MRHYHVTFRRRPRSGRTPDGLMEMMTMVAAGNRQTAIKRAWEKLEKGFTDAGDQPGPRAQWYLKDVEFTQPRGPIS